MLLKICPGPNSNDFPNCKLKSTLERTLPSVFSCPNPQLALKHNFSSSPLQGGRRGEGNRRKNIVYIGVQPEGKYW